MVALLVRLKLTLLRNSLRRSTWRTVGLVLGMVYALAIVGLATFGLVALRVWGTVTLTAHVTTLAFAALTTGWLIMSLLVFGVDETVDPSRFALLPVRSRDLLPGLFVAGLIGSPGIATILVALGQVVAWSRTPLSVVAALLALVLGVATCFLLSRAGTSAFANFLSSRRFRDVAFVVLALLGAVLGIAGNLIGTLTGRDPQQAAAGLSRAAAVVGWTPFGWAWAVPGDVALGRWLPAIAHLLLAAGLVAGLWYAWGHFLGLRLTEPIENGDAGDTVITKTGLAGRLYPDTPAGAVATRTLRYWRRDPRYLASVGAFVVAPVVIIVTQYLSPSPNPGLIAFAPVLLALLVGVNLAQDLSYDGTGLWLHITTGIRGAEDRAGRMMSLVTVMGPLILVLLIISAVLSRRADLMVAVVATTVAVLLVGLGVGAWVGGLWQYPAPPPGASPFQRGNSGGLPSLLSFLVTTGLTVVLSLPVIALVVGSYWVGWLRYAALALAVAEGAAVLWAGLRLGGRLLDRRWPQVLQAVSEKTA